MTGWRRYISAMALGALGALAYAPVGFFPILWVSFPVFIILLQGVPTSRKAFAMGWCFAFGNFVFGLYWIADSMFVDIKDFWWAVPLAVAGLPAFLALYYGLAALMAYRIGLKGIAGALTFALLWFLADYGRGHLLSGFPWNLEGYAWIHILPMLQAVSIVGIYGLTLLTLSAACLMASLAEDKATHRRYVGLSLLLLVLMEVLGTLRLLHAPTLPNEETAFRLRIVQPNTDQAHKWLAEERERHFQDLLDFSSAPGVLSLNMIVWPETASPYYLAEDGLHRQAVVSRLPSNITLITGVIRHDLTGDQKVRYYNSLVAIDHHGDVVATYDKSHLVPFGEYIPYRQYVPIHSLASMGVNFSSGDGVHTLHVEGLPPFSPFICYEAVFPGRVADQKDRPHMLINVTNDGWYGHTAGPYQHFAAARVRAIEEGLPLVRAANTGISGVVDPFGRITARLGVGLSGFVDAQLPAELTPTFFSRYRDLSLWVMIVFFSAFIMISRKKE